MSLLTADEILATDDIPYEDVEVPEWGGTVRVRGLTGTQRARVNGTMMAIKGQDVQVKSDAIAETEIRIVALSLVDEQFQPLFSITQTRKLGEKNAGVISRLFAKANELSGLKKDAVEEMAGNSAAAQSDDSTSD
ncbi:hypothetical protein H0B56_12080 [Haloechinothrix sp. YIM 98757]|uniref:Uncharacterized protein n=1 Tax=Haloechinothrix aidingensis TaxID=2752311 RepID=A0A838AAL4_9PSEU|nr:hypothetical protein [Haloechinothrix aidingensis]MBA0126280.1 hypothetical protein [Haloechinothrix aidingensis]